jgi:pectin methylesterase-like acyl-CoA thioesterase
MYIKSIRMSVCIIALLISSGFLSVPAVKAADMAVTNLFPANNAVGVCADTKLWITFSTTPTVVTDSNMHLQICRVSDSNVVYQLDLNALPKDSYGPIFLAVVDLNLIYWPYKINLNGRTVNYEPFAVNGNTMEIFPSKYPLPQPCLDYNTAYYVKMTAGFCTDSNGNTSPEINNSTTWRFTTKAAAPAADHDYTVALDGSGDFCTLQGAADAVVNSDPCRTIVKVKKGTYREIVNIPSGKTNMTWLGEDRDTTIMAAYNRDKFNAGNDYRMLIRTSAIGFRMYNMTFHNLTPKGGAQAEITKHSANKGMAVNCKYMSYQDTLCISAGQMYMRDCYIEGDTDYIWGAGTAYFDKCEIHSMSTKSHVTQPRAAQNVNGFFLVDCNLTAEWAIIQCDLGRTTDGSYPYCQSVYINCTMPKVNFLPEGWTNTYLTDTSNLRWWEYKSVDPNGDLIDVNSRVSYSKQLDDANALYWRDANHVFGNWNPQALNELPTAAWLSYPADGATEVNADGVTLTWAAGAEAVSHMMYFGTTNPPELVGNLNDNSYAPEAIAPGTTYYWAVDENNPAGQTPGTVWSFATSYICTSPIVSDMDGDCQLDFLDYAILADTWEGILTDIAQLAQDWLVCNRDPASMCWQ